MLVRVLPLAALASAWLSVPAAAQPILGAEAEVSRVAAEARRAYDAGRYRDALIMLRDVHAFAAAELGPDHPATLNALSSVAVMRQVQGDTEGALPQAQAATAGLERALGGDHEETLTAIANLAQLHIARNERAAAEPLLRRVLATRERTLGAADERTLESLLELAVFLSNDGRVREIRAALERGAETARTSFGEDSVIAADLRAAATAAARPVGAATEDSAG